MTPEVSAPPRSNRALSPYPSLDQVLEDDGHDEIPARVLLILIAIAAALAALSTTTLLGDPARLDPDQLDQLVARIALYSDPLLAQVLTASTYADQIPGAAAWADQHRYLHGDDLARAISEDDCRRSQRTGVATVSVSSRRNESRYGLDTSFGRCRPDTAVGGYGRSPAYAPESA